MKIKLKSKCILPKFVVEYKSTKLDDDHVLTDCVHGLKRIYGDFFESIIVNILNIGIDRIDKMIVSQDEFEKIMSFYLESNSQLEETKRREKEEKRYACVNKERRSVHYH